MTPAHIARVAIGLTLTLWGAVGCGGEVGQKISARDDLESNGTIRCQDACDAIASCLPGASCDCACSCPAGATDCSCGPCDCGPERTVEDCVTGCQGSVDYMLAEHPGCEDEMLAVLSCMRGAGCSYETACETKRAALEACTDSSNPPPGSGGGMFGGTPPDAGSSGVSCEAGFGSASGGPAAPGEVQCETGWDGCRDGHQYRVTCTAYERVPLECVCFRDDVAGAKFAPAQCPAGAADVNGPCGWDIQ